MKGLQLLSTGGALPGRVVTNEDLCRQVDTDDAWITTRTGIRQRYYCTESEDAATMAIAAARQALERSGLAPGDIACCVAATLSSPTLTPGIAQTGAVAALSLPENRGKLALFGGIKNARFRRQVLPGDVLTLECELTEQHGPVGIGKATAWVDGERAVNAELMFVITDA